MKLFAALLAGFVCFGANELSNRRAPGFSLPDSSFTRYDLQDYRGKWLLIDFMITKCPHCVELSHALEQVKSKFGNHVAILSVVIVPPETHASVAKYIKDNNVTIPILFDQGQVAASYFNATPEKPSFDTPHLFIINPQGTIVRDFGHVHSDEGHDLLGASGLIKELEALLKQTAGGAPAARDR
jgi:peroxiredoxin